MVVTEYNLSSQPTSWPKSSRPGSWPGSSQPELLAAGPRPKSKHLVFTSAGDHSNLDAWLTGERDFDLWVAYYGDRPGALREQADWYLCRRGAKFQNLHYCYSRWQALLSRYDAIMVMDDDILIDATGITRLFEIQRQFDLWALQPAFRQSGKISWDITRVRPTAKLRYTNFIEMTCPLFRREKLDEFMQVYDPQIVGYGEDWWFLQSMGPDLTNRVAVVDEFTCVNPYDRAKGGEREIDRLRSDAQRKEVWERLKARYGLDERGRRHTEYGRINKPVPDAVLGLIRYFPDWAYSSAKSLARRLIRR